MELEEKYRRCEVAGVAATTEVQAAARVVATENKILRQLLRERGVSAEEIELFLQTCEPPQESSALERMIEQRRLCVPPLSEPVQRNYGSSSPFMFRPSTSPMLPALHGSYASQSSNSYATAPTTAATLSAGLPYGMAHYRGSHYEGYNAFTDMSMLPQHISPSLHLPADVPRDPSTTSCLVAEQLISDIENVSTEAAAGMLGCQPGTDCKVRTSDVFDAMGSDHGEFDI